MAKNKVKNTKQRKSSKGKDKNTKPLNYALVSKELREVANEIDEHLKSTKPWYKRFLKFLNF
jgi:hypothetical protein